MAKETSAPVMTEANNQPIHVDQLDPVVRQKMAEEFLRRQLETKPPRANRIFEVSCLYGRNMAEAREGRLETRRVEAADESEAWSKFCDAMQKSDEKFRETFRQRATSKPTFKDLGPVPAPTVSVN